MYILSEILIWYEHHPSRLKGLNKQLADKEGQSTSSARIWNPRAGALRTVYARYLGITILGPCRHVPSLGSMSL